MPFLLLLLTTLAAAQVPEGIRIEGAVATYVKAPAYPVAARAKQLQGNVDLDLTIAADGSVADAHVLNGPLELRRAALLAVLQWQFLEEPGRALVSIDFNYRPLDTSKAKISKIAVDRALPTALRAVVERRLQAFVGLPSTQAVMEEARQALLALHPDLQLSDGIVMADGATGASLNVMGKLGLRGSTIEEAAGEDRIRVAGSEQKKRLLSQGNLVYPPLARQARIQGTVRFELLVGKDGLVKNLSVEWGHPLLVPAALEAVKGNLYQPLIRDGQTVEVLSSIDVEFRLVNQP